MLASTKAGFEIIGLNKREAEFRVLPVEWIGLDIQVDCWTRKRICRKRERKTFIREGAV